ncbi:hypothetical protein [Algibacter sp.]|uniref:hypothetical protein n=1 Tax=Algibacter sp. TaxID=1872428 RepID=UPI003C720B66
MKNEMIFDNVKFWLDQHIIHCSFNEKFDDRILDNDIENLFIEVITALTIGNCKPILIDLTQVSNVKACSLYRFISRNSELKSYVISKSFLVKSINIKLLFKLLNIGNDGVIPVKISTNLNNAVQYSNEKYLEFNAF